MFECEYCHHSFPSSQSICPHCARPALYPNVRAAERPKEQEALKKRYDLAVQDAVARGAEKALQEFETTIAQSKPVIARSFRELDRLASSPNELYSTYYDLIEAGNRLPNGDKWNRLRVVADPALFHGYHQDIRFAALTLNDKGLPGYGDCFLLLKDDMVAHRSSAFEENSLEWVLHHDIKFADVFKDEDAFPYGYRAVWSDRTKLAVAKLGSYIQHDTASTSYADILMKPGADSDEFIEVHIWGPLSVYSLEQVTLSQSMRKTSQAIARGANERLRAAGVSIGVK